MSVLGLKTNVSRLLHTIQINKKSLGGGGGEEGILKNMKYRQVSFFDQMCTQFIVLSVKNKCRACFVPFYRNVRNIDLLIYFQGQEMAWNEFLSQTQYASFKE